MAAGVNHHSSPGQPKHGQHTSTHPKTKRKQQNPLILDTDSLFTDIQKQDVFVEEIVRCELFTLLTSSFPSCTRLSSHVQGYQGGLTLQVLLESPQIYSSTGTSISCTQGLRRKPLHLNASQQPLELSANEQPLSQHHWVIMPQGCSPGATREPSGATVYLQQFNSRKPKGARTGGHEGTEEWGAGAQSR